jgi:hypothetical protein
MTNANHTAAPAPTPCDDCNLRTFCAKGADCQAYRRYVEGDPITVTLSMRGVRIRALTAAATKALPTIQSETVCHSKTKSKR